MVKFALIAAFYFSIGCISSCAPQVNRTLTDSAEIFEKIKQNENLFKKQKSRLLRRIETTDSVKVYGYYKKSMTISTISVINRRKENKYYWFLNNKLYKISLLKHPEKVAKRKEMDEYGIYFIENNAVFYKEEKRTMRDVNILISEANMYLKEGLKILQEL